jgi:hypothetical protein
MYFVVACLISLSVILTVLKKKQNIYTIFNLNLIAFGNLFFIRLLYDFCFVSLASKQYIQIQRQKDTMKKKEKKRNTSGRNILIKVFVFLFVSYNQTYLYRIIRMKRKKK